MAVQTNNVAPADKATRCLGWWCRLAVEGSAFALWWFRDEDGERGGLVTARRFKFPVGRAWFLLCSLKS